MSPLMKYYQKGSKETVELKGMCNCVSIDEHPLVSTAKNVSGAVIDSLFRIQSKKDTCSAWQEFKVKVYSSLLIFAYFQSVLKASEVPAAQVKGMGFDATCSLVALSADFQPVSCSPTGEVRGQADLTGFLFVCAEDVWVFVHRPSQLQSGMNWGITAT